MNGALVHRICLVFALHAVLFWTAPTARAQEPLRPQSADESSAQIPAGWKAIERAVYDAYATAVENGRTGHPAGILERASYRLKLQPDGSLTGAFRGTIDLTGDPAFIPLGKPSFAISDVELEGEKAVWGSDAQGIVRLLCARDAAELRFQCSQQGIRRGDLFEFSIDWFTAVATQVDLNIPSTQTVDTQGLLKTGQRNESDGSITLSYEAGARANCTVRIHPRSAATSQPLGVDIRQTLSATPTKVLLQSIVGILATTSGPAFAEFDLPSGFSLSRATLGSDERLPIDRSPQAANPLRIPLGDLVAGQRVELRLVLERPAEWAQPLAVPRVAPRNGVLLREELALQIERPLEVLSVQAPDYEMASLSVEPAREVWNYRGASQSAALTLTVRAPTAEWSADCYVKRRQQGQRSEIVTLVDLKSLRSPLFEFDVDIKKPWKILSVTAPDAVGNPLPLTSEPVEDSERSVRHRILLRVPATPQRGTTVAIAVAAQSTDATSPLHPVVTPIGSRVENFVLATSIEEPSEHGPLVQLTALRSGLRTSAFFEPVKLGSAAIHRVVGPKSVQSPQSLPVTPEPGPSPAKSEPPTPPKPMKDGQAVAELQTLIGTSTSPSRHRAQFVFSDPVDVSGEIIRFEGDWTFIDVLCDGAPVHAVAEGRELRLPDFPRGVREIAIRYTTATAASGIPRRDRVDWPQIPASVQSWTWRVEAPTERRVTEIDAPVEFATGIMRPGLRERLLAPLSRATGVPIFNPLRAESWNEFLNPPQSNRTEPQRTLFVAAVGRDYPASTSIVSWSAPLLVGTNWVLFIGGMLAAAIVRSFKRGTFRFAAAVSAIAATAAWLLPPPFGSMAGSILGGNVLAYCIPRRFLAPQPVELPRAAGSSIVRFAGVTALLIAALAPAISAIAQTQALAPNILLLERDGEPAPFVVVSESVAKDIAAWQLDLLGPPSLIRSAKYDVAVDETDLASASLDFDVVVPRPDLTRTIQLPFEGLTFRGPDAARINGELAKLVPAADGSGILLALPPSSSPGPAKPASFRVQLAAGIRIPSGSSKREFAVTIPRCSAAVGSLQFSTGRFKDFRSTSRGRTEISTDKVVCALGTVARWHARWRTGDVSDRPADSAVTARAESVVMPEPQALYIQTRLICETPELADPFGTTRLEVTLPAGCIVSSATGQSLVAWTTRPESDSVKLLLDFTSPPIVGQLVDLQYELPLHPAARIDSRLIEIPPIPLLPPLRLSSHQIAVVASPAFQLEMLSKPDPDAGLWTVEPGEASFSLRKDRGLPIPSAAIELERPSPLTLKFSRRATGRIAELEQSLNSRNDSISWTGTARIETSVRPGFLYEFRVDPAVEITSASVIEREVERLSRFIREGDRLLLVVGDDRLGTKNVRLEGQLRLEAGKIRTVPTFDLEDTVITRREIVVTSSADQLLQLRKKRNASLLVGKSDTEWEPESPSSVRLSLPTSESDYELRWINPASPLRLVEFLRLPEDGTSACSIEWRLESNQPLPQTLAIDAPRGTQLLDSDFAEEDRHPLPDDRVRIDLQSRSSRLAEAKIFLVAPIQSGGDQNGHLPHLFEASVQPVTYLAVPQALLERCEIPGDFLDQLPARAPDSWKAPFHSRDLLVFLLAGIDWRVATTGAEHTVGDATAEILTSDSKDGLRGLTRLIITPSRAAVLRIEAPPSGTLNSVTASPGALLHESGPSAWNVLLRPSQPAAVVIDWATPPRHAALGQLPGPATPQLNLQVAYQATISRREDAPWSPEILTRSRGADILASVRLENLLAAARKLPIGVRPPAWLRDELQELARAWRDSPVAGHVSVQVEGLLDTWSARMSTMTAPNAVAPESSLIRSLPQQALAEQMLVAAADPDLVVETPPHKGTWSLPRRAFNGAFMSAWLIFWAFVVTKGGQWAARKQLADRIAKHPGALLLGIGLAWWLLLSPSAFGILLATAGLLWELSLLSYRRTASPPAAAT